MAAPYVLRFASGADYVECAGCNGAPEHIEVMARPDAVGGGPRPLLQNWGANDGHFAFCIDGDGRLRYAVRWQKYARADEATGEPVYEARLAQGFSAAGLIGAGVWGYFSARCVITLGVDKPYYPLDIAITVQVDGVDVTAGMSDAVYTPGGAFNAFRIGGALDGEAVGFVGQMAWLRSGRYYASLPPWGAPPPDPGNTVESAVYVPLTEGDGATAAGYAITGATWGRLGGADGATRNALLNHVLGGGSYTRPATLYLGLGTALPFTAAAEVSGNGYARIAVPNNATNFPAYNGGKTCQAAPVFTPAESWGLVRAWGVWDAASGGNLLAWGPTAYLYDTQGNVALRGVAGALQLGWS